MNEDIKEILDRLFVYRNENDEMKYQPEDILTIEDVWLLLDYITNLQTIEQQYSAILSENAELENRITNLQERIDKAYNYVLNCEDELIPANVGWVNDLKNILKWSDNNE